MLNPFICGSPVSPERFIGRHRELRRVVNRVISGQSTAIVGEPRYGKTSLLHYLSAHETVDVLYPHQAPHLIFSFLDAQMLAQDTDPAQFWGHVLRPLYVHATRDAPELVQAYDFCQRNAFGIFAIENLLSQVLARGWRLVVLLDEFDELLHHPVLHSAEFFGGLRALTTRSRGALTLVIATRSSLAKMHKSTHGISRMGSPYFNHLYELPLDPLLERDVAKLLALAGERFTAADRRFVVQAAGGHPYLIQAGASALWEAYADGERIPIKLWKQAGESLYREALRTIGETWRHWTPEMRQAFASVGLAQIPKLLGHREFVTERFVVNLDDFRPELRMLAARGCVEQDASAAGGWRVRPIAFLWWLSDELIRVMRDDTDFREWLRREELLKGALRQGELDRLISIASRTVDLLQDGVTSMIEALGTSLGKTMVQ